MASGSGTGTPDSGFVASSANAMYCTVEELKHELLNIDAYTASTISFTNSTSKIEDTAYGLKGYQENDVIEISGSAQNDGYYTIATGNDAGEIVVNESLTDESAGESVTIKKVIDIPNDEALEAVILAASRAIDGYTRRRFYTTAADETRTYTPDDSELIYTDDIVSITTLKTDEDGDRVYEYTWTTDDYDLLPLNNDLDGEPWHALQITPEGDYAFPLIARGVQIVGKFGWASAPNTVKQFALMFAARLVKRKQTPLGLAGGSGVGRLTSILEKDPDTEVLLGHLRRYA